MANKFPWGVIRAETDLIKYVDALIQHFSDQGVYTAAQRNAAAATANAPTAANPQRTAEDMALEHIENVLERFGNKSASLLTIVGIFLAFATFFFSTKQTYFTDILPYLAALPIAALLGVSILLTFNLGITWWDDEPKAFTSKDLVLRVMRLVSNRGRNFLIGLWVSRIAFIVLTALILFQMLCLARSCCQLT